MSNRSLILILIAAAILIVGPLMGIAALLIVPIVAAIGLVGWLLWRAERKVREETRDEP